jgi:hypothetical protein
MKTYQVLPVIVLTALCNPIGLGAGEPQRSDDSLLRRTFDLAAQRSAQPQRFEMESQMITYGLDGKRLSTDIFRLHLKCVPGQGTGQSADEYTCTKFTVQLAGAPEVELPAMKDWSYRVTPAGEKGPALGIDHAQFEKLVDAKGQPVPADKAYHVYNAFIDFHTFCNVLAQPAVGGKGIQDLTTIGQKIVHVDAFSEAPVNLGSSVKEGSTFKNGEVTLELKGLSLVDDAACALLAYDSGASSFQMIITPMPNLEVRTVGSSHYKGDIHVDLATRWVRKATMNEWVVTETIVPTLPNKMNAVVERNLVIRNVTPKTGA